MQQPFNQWCAGQLHRIRTKASYRPGYQQEGEEDVYEGPADLHQGFIEEYRQGYQTTRRDTLGVTRRGTPLW